MKRITLFALIFHCFTIQIYSQSNNYNWITPNKTYLKMYVNSDGIYRINKTDFTNAGINTSSINPRTVKLLYKGQQQPIFFQGEDDGVFDDNDFFDFYGKRNRGGITPHRDAFSNNIAYNTDEQYNFYSDTSAYWVDWGGDNGLRMQRSEFISSVNYPETSFLKKVHFEKDRIYDLGETTNPNGDYRYFSNEIVAGESWFWRTLETNTTENSFLKDSLFIDDLGSTTQLCSLKLFVYPRSFNNSVLNEHRIEVYVNDTFIDTLRRDNFRRFDTTITFSSALLNNNSYNYITFQYRPLGFLQFYPVVNFDFFAVSYPRDFTMRNNRISISLPGTDTASKKINIPGYNSAQQLNLYDIKNNIKIEGISSSGNVLTFTGKSNGDFEIVNNNITQKPFRIISRQVRDLVSANNTAEYLIIYNKLFESQANQLKSHRESFNNFDVFNAEIQDIYDVYNYGMEDPVAVRYFVKHVYESWKLPRLRFVCLFGRASLDPKKNSPSSVYYQNFVPTYGNPPSDGYFVNLNIGTFTYSQKIPVGRLPVYSVTEAQNVVEKLISYDFQQPDKWWKRFLFITGGPDRSQQINFQAKSENLINRYIAPPSVSGFISRIYRNDSSGYVTYNYKDSIKKEFDKGAMLVNFIGHAAAQDWEIGLEDPNTLNNQNKLPLVLSFTCFTGRNAEPYFRSFGENFLLLPNKCAISFIGTTGWSFFGIGDQFNDSLLKHFSRDSSRFIGELLQYSSLGLSRDSNNFSTRNTINCYNLIGDPATELLIPGNPEFDINQNDYVLSNPFPAVGEIVKLTAYPKNLGLYVDTLRIRYNMTKNGQFFSRKDTVISNFSYLDTIDHYFQVDSIGNYRMSIVLDPLRAYTQKFTQNDSVTFDITLRNLSYVQIKPVNSALLKDLSFRFTGLNPNVNSKNNNVKVILQIDTNKSFSSPVLQTYNNSSITGVKTDFNVTLPVSEVNTVYYMRTNALINSDSSGWSDIHNVIYNPLISDDRSRSDSAYTIYTTKPGQFQESYLTNIQHSPDGFILEKFNGILYIRSYGSNANEASFFTINNINYYSDDGANTGLNIAKVKKLTGNANEIKNFRMSSPVSSDSVLAFLNTFDSTDYIMAYIASYVANADSLRPDAISKLAQFGSRFVDSVDFDFFDTWSFFGFIGADTSDVCEVFHRWTPEFGQVPSDCQLNPVFQKTSGEIAQIIGPSNAWKNFSWDQILNPSSFIQYDVYGINLENTGVLLLSGVTSNSGVNLDTVNASVYPNMKLTARLSIDTVTGLESPVFKSFKMNYVPPAELIPDNNSFTGTDSAVQEGDSVSFSISYYNAGYLDIQQYYYNWYIRREGAFQILKSDTVNSLFNVDSMRTAGITFSTAGLRDPKILSDTIDLYFEINLFEGQNELFTYNNTALSKFVIQGDTVTPVMDVTYDGIKINNGDFIQSKPDIKLQFFDDSRMVISDTSSIKVYTYDYQTFRFIYVPYFINGVKNPVIDINFPDDRFLQATVNFKPVLSSGEHQFRYVATDISGNFADSITNTVIVDNDLRINSIANYPNPMKTETSFMFNLSGELNPTSCKVKIYTVAGRMIKEINYPAVIGYNQINWDGKDSDGDYIANGTYLYKFIIQGNSQIETSIQKLAVLR